MIKSVTLLTIALFFTVAPSPDAEALSEMTGGFLKAQRHSDFSGPETNPAAKVDFIKQQASFDDHTHTLAQNGI